VYIVKTRKWVECSSEYAAIFLNITEKELEVISIQIRREKSLSNKHYLVTARDIAAFLRNSRIMEIELTESKKALEMHEAGVFGGGDSIEEAQQYVHPNMSHITEATEIYEELDS
jgi:hypothetical protein